MISAEQYGPWAIIAGGSEGIGACFAHRLAASGIHLILLARRVEPLERTADALRQEHGVEVRTLALDLSSPDALSQIRAISDDVEVGALIYNAGGAGNAAALVDQSPESALGNLHLNTSTPTALVQHFAKPMRNRGRGGLLLIGSLGCIAGTKELAVYSAAKSYLLTFGEAIWAELTPHGVHSLVLVIGRTLTPALQRAGLGDTEDAPAADPDQMAALGLDNWNNGPVLVDPSHMQAFEAMRAMPRRKAVEIMVRSMEQQRKR